MEPLIYQTTRIEPIKSPNFKMVDDANEIIDCSVMCNHVLGISWGYEKVVCRDDDTRYKKDMDVHFFYCPDCGVKL